MLDLNCIYTQARVENLLHISHTTTTLARKRRTNDAHNCWCLIRVFGFASHSISPPRLCHSLRFFTHLLHSFSVLLWSFERMTHRETQHTCNEKNTKQKYYYETPYGSGDTAVRKSVICWLLKWSVSIGHFFPSIFTFFLPIFFVNLIYYLFCVSDERLTYNRKTSTLSVVNWKVLSILRNVCKI